MRARLRIILVGLMVVAGLMVVLAYRQLPYAGLSRCHSQEYQAVIEHDQIQPATVTAQVCDQLTITNRDHKTRLIAFGLHQHHQSYDGITERLLLPSESFTIELNQVGV